MPHLINNDENSKMSFYEKGIMYRDKRLPGPAIRAFQMTLEYSAEDKHKACYELSKIYLQLQDIDSAYESCCRALMLNPKYIEALYFIAHILSVKKVPLEEFKKKIDDYILSAGLNYNMAADIFYMEGYYRTSIEYIDRYEREFGPSGGNDLLRVKCLIRSGWYNQCIDYISTISENNLYLFKIMMLKTICLAVTNRAESIWDVLSKFSSQTLAPYSQKELSVYHQFYNLLSKRDTFIICNDKYDKDYSSYILEILSILLETKEFDCFFKVLPIIRLVKDRTIFLQLGKLYYKTGYTAMAKNEIIKSVKLFDLIDDQGLDILQELCDDVVDKYCKEGRH